MITLVTASQKGLIHIRTIKKRSGQTVPFDTKKIYSAISKANAEVKRNNPTAHILKKPDLGAVTLQVSNLCSDPYTSVEQVQDTVEKVLAEQGFFEVSKAYILYREKHRIRREATEHLMEQYHDLLFTDAKDNPIKRENGNINGDSPMGIMLRIGTEATKVFAKYYSMPDEFAKAHDEGWIHIHDLDFSEITWNCCQIDLLKVFHGGFSTGHGSIREPQSIRAYAALACVVVQANQNDQFR